VAWDMRHDHDHDLTNTHHDATTLAELRRIRHLRDDSNRKTQSKVGFTVGSSG
jgi:hypothetical protein